MKICLNMIVRNEEAVIERCLKSVLPFIDCWCIQDTGSTDGTKEIIKRVLGHVPGLLFDVPWSNFGFNRTRAVSIAQEMVVAVNSMGERCGTLPELGGPGFGDKADFILFMDADDQLVDSMHFNPCRLEKGKSHFVSMTLGDTSYRRMLIVPNTVAWRWEGVIHEYPVPAEDVASSPGVVPNLMVLAGVEGARSRDPEKYQKDAELLRLELEKDPTNARNQFYYAQSLSHAGNAALALSAYLIRVELGGFEEECWYAKYQAGMMSIRAGVYELAERYLRDALLRRPWRAEPALELSRLYMGKKDFSSAYAYASLAATTPYPRDDQLFVDQATYEWASMDALSIAAYWLGRKEESKIGCLALLGVGSKLPETERGRVKANLMHSI